MLGLKGTGNTLRHQLIISDILYAFTHKTRTTDKYKNYRCVPEIGLDKTVPDIVIYKIVRGEWKPKIIFEISNNPSGFSKDLDKCEKLMRANTSIDEVFVIDISKEKIKLKKLKKGKHKLILNPVSDQQCDMFKIKVLDCLKSI
jgi:Uma2 family endonuclease